MIAHRNASNPRPLLRRACAGSLFEAGYIKQALEGGQPSLQLEWVALMLHEQAHHRRIGAPGEDRTMAT